MDFVEILNRVSNLHNGNFFIKNGDHLVEVSPSQTAASGWGRAWSVISYYTGKENFSPKAIEEGLLLIEEAFTKNLEYYALYNNIKAEKLSKKSLESIGLMKKTIDKLSDKDLANKVNQFYDRMIQKKNKVEELNTERLLDDDQQKLFKDLENSVIGLDRGANPRLSPVYFRNKIKLYLALYSDKLTQFQRDLLNAVIDQTNQLFSKSNDYNKFVEEKLSYLDHLDNPDTFAYEESNIDKPEARIGVLFANGYRYRDDGIIGHFTPIGCRKENNKYIVTSYNAGLGAEEINLKEKPNGEYEGRTVVEYEPMTRHEVFNFLVKSYKEYDCVKPTEQQAIQAFIEILKSKKIVQLNELPVRDFQRIGNCSIRNLIEWMIYNFQRQGEEKLANDLVFFGIVQDKTTHTKRPIDSYEKDDGFIPL